MPTAPPASNLDEAREILFGDRHRELDGRIGRVEATVAWHRADIGARIDAMEQNLTQRLDDLTNQLSSQIAALEAELAECQRQLRNMQADDGDTGSDD